MPRIPNPTPKFVPSHPSAPWRIYYRGTSFWFKTEAKALKKQKDLLKGRGMLTLRQEDEYLHARRLLEGVPLLVAVRYYLERNPVADDSTTVAKAIKSYLAKLSGRPAYVDRMEYMLGFIKEDYGNEPLSSLGGHSIQKILNTLTSKWVANDFLRYSRVFFRYCMRPPRKLLRDDPTEGFTTASVQASKVILSIADTKLLLETCAKAYPKLLPAIALQLFTGIRSEEVCRLEWKDVRIGKLVNIEPEVSKTKERRVIDWWPAALANWMPKEPGEGRVVEEPKKFSMHKFELVSACRKARKDFRFGQNACRHTYASFGVAYFQNAGKIALLMGHHDANLIFRHYRDYRTEKEANAYFALKR